MNIIKNIPHKILFYFGFFTVLIFILLAYWQFNRYLDNRNDNYVITEHIDISNMQVDDIEENTSVTINGTFTLMKYYFLRSRVHNGESGYNLVGIYSDQNESNIVINHGWIPLEKNNYKLKSKIESFQGILLKFDTQPLVGQDDLNGSEYIFRIEKEFIENDQNIKIKSKYILLSINCGEGIECASSMQSYDAPHLSYAFQWIFFSLCLSIVILRKNNFI